MRRKEETHAHNEPTRKIEFLSTASARVGMKFYKRIGLRWRWRDDGMSIIELSQVGDVFGGTTYPRGGTRAKRRQIEHELDILFHFFFVRRSFLSLFFTVIMQQYFVMSLEWCQCARADSVLYCQIQKRRREKEAQKITRKSDYVCSTKTSRKKEKKSWKA